PRNPGIKAWSELSDKERRVYARYMEVYAGIIHRLDVNIGRLIDFLDARKLIDNTLIVLFSDHGASPEGTPDGTPNLLATAGG
ncbi:sulfatase-like hydrolase/transferase, partial [Acinetobacter baumannii]